jgi:hypothetical protein
MGKKEIDAFLRNENFIKCNFCIQNTHRIGISK